MTRIAIRRGTAAGTMVACLVLAATVITAGTVLSPPAAAVVPSLYDQAMEQGPPAEPLPGHDTATTRWYPGFDSTNLCTYIDSTRIEEFTGERTSADHMVFQPTDPYRAGVHIGSGCRILFAGESDIHGDPVSAWYSLDVGATVSTPIPNIYLYGANFEARRSLDIDACEIHSGCEYQDLDNVPGANDAYSATFVSLRPHTDNELSYLYVVWAGNLMMTVRLTGGIATDVDGTEYTPHVHAIAEDLLDRLYDQRPLVEE
ncbi:hypothetical protein LX16_1152 [Stackebrandtia albiflava]|uniref:Uncharacterized protein n=1 Tax=Stackebrandtia albiflava TaxID=406432 RepID=A0A562VC28_9ACTN|nr:hypothetical protein [Stackebrandtia albiflava]TWJ15443.1 hypothetical protein LX16_1152 [Stackebrandtia albiflava]